MAKQNCKKSEFNFLHKYDLIELEALNFFIHTSNQFIETWESFTV